MLESLVASILNRVLGSYVENFDPKNLNIGLLSGDVKLGNLRLKRSALDQLQLPVDVVDGHIGSLILQIPYSNLKSKPVKVVIEDVFLMAKPEFGHNEETMRRREQTAKLNKLQLWEISSERAVVRSSQGNSQTTSADDREKQNFTSSLVTKIIENLQVTIRNIHIRFEDKEIGLALGATLGELSAVSTNKDWEPAFIADVGATTHKLATLDSLAFYMDPHMENEFTNTTTALDRQQMLDEFKAFIFDSVGATDVLRPINGQGFITINKMPQSEDTPRIKADLKFEELSLALDREQYVDAVILIDRFQTYLRAQHYRVRRPTVGVKDEPLAWFRYAALTVLDRVHEKRSQWSWEHIKSRLDDQRDYIALYKTWYRGGSSPQALSGSEKQRFDELQNKYGYDDLVFFRYVAKKILISEKATNQQTVAQPQQSWSSWLWGSKQGATADVPSSNPHEAPIELTEEQRQELLEVLDVPDLNEDADTQILNVVEFSLGSAGLRLTANNRPLTSAGFDGVKATFINRPNAFSFEMSVLKFAVSDLTVRNRFSEVISVQRPNKSSSDPFFWFLFEQHPADRAADSNLFLKSQSVEIIHNARLLEAVMDFFAPPPDHDETVDAILVAANRTVEELREQTRIGLEYALENHKTLNLQLDIKAPTIIIPLNTEEDESAAIILDVGSLQMASDLVPENVIREVKSKQALQYSKDDWKRLESLMYDRFTITLRDTQVLLGDNMSVISSSLGKSSSNMHFLDKTTLKFLLEISIVPKTRSLARSRLSITLPNLRATVADVQYMLFMKILSEATPRARQYNPDSRERSREAGISSKKVESISRDMENELDNKEQKTNPESKQDVTEKDLEAAESKRRQQHPQRNFELVFTVDEVNFLVVRGWDATPVVNMCLHGFRIECWSTDGLAEESLAVDLTVRDLLVTDHLGSSGPAQLHKIIESESHADSHQISNDDNLFSVQYRRSDIGDQNINIALAAMKFVLNPTTVVGLYDYIMSTFTSPSEPGSSGLQTPQLKDADAEKKKSETDSDVSPRGLISVQMSMQSVTAALVDDSAVFSTVIMDQATVSVNLKESLQFKCILGAISISDHESNELLSIDGGGNLADFRYETEPVGDDGMTPLGPSLVYLRTRPLKLVILEDPFTKLVGFLTRFTAMKAVYDQARMMAFNQAIQVEPSKFKFDVVMSTPIIKWPHGNDWVQLDLGEVYLHNQFKGSTNDLEAGVRNVRIVSRVLGDEVEAVPKTDFNVHLVYAPDEANVKVPITELKSTLSPIHVKLNEHQLRIAMLFMTSLQTISAGTAAAGLDPDEVGNLRRQLAKEKRIEERQTSYWWGENSALSLAPRPTGERRRPQLDFGFSASLLDISLEFEGRPLSYFALRETVVEVAIDQSSVLEMNFHIRSFSAEDTNTARSNKFPKIIPPISHDGHQVIGRIIRRANKPLNVECSIDSPQVIFALDYMLSLRKFLDHGLIAECDHDQPDSDESEYGDGGEGTIESYMDQDYESTLDSASDSASTHHPLNDDEVRREIEERSLLPVVSINIVDMYLTVLADQSDEDTESVVFKIEQLVLNTGATSTLSVSRVGMFLTRMKHFDAGKLRLLDDFNITGTLDNSESTDHLRLSNIQLSVDPLVLRISLREIGLILDITKKASAIWATEAKGTSKVMRNSDPPAKKATNFFEDDHRVARSGSEVSRGDIADADGVHALRVLGEQLMARFEGFRFVLIDPVHQLPMTDFCIKPFSLVAKNWSDSLVVDAKAELYANVHSFTKSAWEPLIDTMEIGFNVTGDALELFSTTVADIELTPETLELSQDIRNYFSNSSSETFQRDRHEDGSPYRIRNETGYQLTVWSDSERTTSSRRRISSGEEIKWSFHDWRVLRENLNATDQDASIGIEIEGSDHDTLRSVPVNKIGEHLYAVGNHSQRTRVLVDITVKNHLKYITIRSTEVVFNETQTDLEIMLVGGNEHPIFQLPAKSSRPLPIADVDSHILVRRSGDQQWSAKAIYWQELIDSGEISLQCADDFNLSVIPVVPDVPLARKYPYLAINLTAPFQLVNNLPQDFDFQLYSRDTRHESRARLDRAGRTLVHDYHRDQLLLLRVDVPGYNSNRFAVINKGNKFGQDFETEDSLEITQGRQRLYLQLEYVDLPNGKGRVIVVYSPYIILNSSGSALLMTEHMNQVVCSPSQATLWSFNTDSDRPAKRVSLTAQGSHASAPVPLDASGSSFEVVMVSKDRRSDLYLGVNVTQGVGRYINTKVISITPRFILWNLLDRQIDFHEPGGQRVMSVAPNERSAVGFVSTMANREMCARFSDSEQAEWSSSFAMANVGTTYVRLTEKGKPTVLVKIEVILENATLFLHITRSKTWPFSIRNFTDYELHFYQSNPFVDADGADRDSRFDRFTPIKYRLPPRSAMPYSWDFPAAEVKQLILEPDQPQPGNVSTRSSTSIAPSVPDTEADAPALPARPGSRSQAPSSRRGSFAPSIALSSASTAATSRERRSHRVRRRKIQLAEIGDLPPANFGNGMVVDLSVIADGPQQALVIAPYQSESSAYDMRTNEVKAEAVAEVEAVEARTGRLYKVNFKGLGVSCITPKGQELLYVTLRNIKLGYSVSDALESFSLQVQWIQVDNCLPGSTEFPVIIYPTVVPKAAEEMAAHPCFSASVTRVADDSYGLTYIKHATLLLQEMTIEADEDFLLNAVDLVIAQGRAAGHSDSYVPIVDDDSFICSDEIHVPEPTSDATSDIYFEQLHLQPIQLNLSFMRTGSLSSSAVFKDSAAASGVAFIIDALTMTLGNINDAPLRFNALLLENVRTQALTLMNMTQMHYQQEFIYQVHKIIGSADIIGNPVGLFNNISSGVMDLFYEPYLGYTLNDRPQEFGVGLAKGGLSFMKKSVFGLSDSISKVTGSLSKGLTAITLDPRYQKTQRARRARNRPRHAVYGLKYGLESFYDSFSSGITGLAEAPLQGAYVNGSSGFFRGLGVGILGLPTKTAIGLLDFASNVSEGVRNTTTVFDAHTVARVRLPRVIANDGVVRPYNVRESVGQMILHSVKDGKFAKDQYLAHSNLTHNMVVVVSLEHVLVASVAEMTLDWAVSYNQISAVTLEKTGITLQLRGGVRGPFIPIQDQDTRQYIYKNIAQGVSNYEQKRIAIY